MHAQSRWNHVLFIELSFFYPSYYLSPPCPPVPPPPSPQAYPQSLSILLLAFPSPFPFSSASACPLALPPPSSTPFACQIWPPLQQQQQLISYLRRTFFIWMEKWHDQKNWSGGGTPNSFLIFPLTWANTMSSSNKLKLPAEDLLSRKKMRETSARREFQRRARGMRKPQLNLVKFCSAEINFRAKRRRLR